MVTPVLLLIIRNLSCRAMLVAASEPHTFPMRFIQRSSVLLKPVTKTYPLALVVSLYFLKKRRGLYSFRQRTTDLVTATPSKSSGLGSSPNSLCEVMITSEVPVDKIDT